MSRSKHWMELRDESFKKYVSDRQRQKLTAKTPNQGRYIKAIENSVVTICTGPAGCGKSFVACGLAAQMLKDGRVNRIVISRPLVSCGRGYGFRPGTVEEKVAPDMRPMIEALQEFLGPDEVVKLMETKVIEMWPLDDMRGANIPNSFIICDEAQNAEREQLRMLLTRFAKGSRLVICGDASQTDLKRPGLNPLLDVIRRFEQNCHRDIRIIRLGREDIVRHPLLQWIDERFDEYYPMESDLGPAPSYQPSNWQSIECPSCQKTIFFESLVKKNNLLLSCCHCGSCIELLDEDGKFDPVVVDEKAEYLTKNIKAYEFSRLAYQLT